MKKILFTLALAFAGLSAGAQNFYYYENEDGTLTITHAEERWHGPEGNQHYGTCHSYTGDIVMDDTAKAAFEETPAKVSITKAASFDHAAPEGYVWVNAAAEGEQTIQEAGAKIGKLLGA